MAEKQISDSVTSSDELKNEEQEISGGEKGAEAGVTFKFGTKTWREDTTLTVEGKRLYVSSSILALMSPVFTKLFEEKMNTDGPLEVDLEGKRYNDIVEFLECIYPNIMKKVTLENVFVVLPLAVEFGMEQLTRSSENVLLENTSACTQVEDIYMYLSKASEFNLNELRNKCIEVASKKSYNDLQRAEKKFPTPVETKLEIQSKLLVSMDHQLVQRQKVIEAVNLHDILFGEFDPLTLNNPRIVYNEYTVSVKGNKSQKSGFQTVAHGIGWRIEVYMPKTGAIGIYFRAKLLNDRWNDQGNYGEWTCRACGLIRLCNLNAAKSRSGWVDHVFTASENNWGPDDDLPMQRVLDEQYGFINDDTIKVEVCFLVEEPEFE